MAPTTTHPLPEKNTPASRKVLVMIVDDSAVVRQSLSEVLSSDPDIEVIATATDPYAAVRKMQKQAPDVLLLDIEMPRMDGLSFLRKVMHQHPMPVVICSGVAEPNSTLWLKAFEYGAVDVIPKLKMGTKRFIEEARVHIIDTVKAAAMARLDRTSTSEPASGVAHPQPSVIRRVRTLSQTIIVIGASTGGVEAIQRVLTAMPPDAPGIVIVQHMPEHFTSSFAQRLDSLCAIEVKEASNMDEVRVGRALIAPGGRHTSLKRVGTRFVVEVRDGPLVSRHRPSVDVLFKSAARYASENAIAALLTGMGSDGAQGMLELKQAGATTIAQDEATSVVYGMPREAVRLGAVDKVVGIDRIAAQLLHTTR